MLTQTDNDPAARSCDLLRMMAKAMQRDADRTNDVQGRVAPDAATLFDFSQRLLQASSPELALRILADGLKELTGCRTVVVARRYGRVCRVKAVSQVDAFDAHAQSIVEYQSRCTAALTEDGIDANGVSAIKLYDDEPLPSYVCLLIDDRVGPAASPPSWTSQVAAAVAPALLAKMAALDKPRPQLVWERMAAAWRWDRRIVTALFGAIMLLGFVPWTYQVSCECVIEPVVRRHVAAPFDAVFAESLCRPGDEVSAGQVLGRLDSKELTWELAAVTADRDRAAKSRDVNQSAGKAAAAQIDRLEAQRLDERRKLLEHRLNKLEIKSPIDGIVVTGDLERVQGAPVKAGQSLYEVAPLDRMVIEIAVPEREIDYLRLNQDVRIRPDAHGSAAFDGRVEWIYPRAEIRNEANVFIAEATLDNREGKLRPGMKGCVAVATERCPLAWIVGHRLIEAFYRWIS